MLSKDEVAKALSTAQEALAQGEHLSWIRKSALVERAYLSGVIMGLKSIGAADDLHPMLNPFINTLWPRKGDDTFPATQIGQKFALLRGHLEEDLQKRYEHLHKRVEQLDGLLTSPDANQPIQESIRELRDSVIQASANFKEALKRIDEILSEFRPLQPNQTATEEEFRKRAEVVSRAKESLEGPLRFVALLETDHKLEKRLER